MNKQILMSALGSTVSKTTVQEALNLDPDRERERMKREQLDDHDSQKDVEREIQRREQNLAAQARAEEEGGGRIPAYNQQKLMAAAQEQAAQLLGVPYEERKSLLAQLQNEDYVMWALVSKQLEALRGREA